jgi:hypothetical protein
MGHGTSSIQHPASITITITITSHQHRLAAGGWRLAQRLLFL